MNKIFTTLAVAAMAMLSVGTSYAQTTVFEDNYADYCVKNIEYGKQVESSAFTYTDADFKLEKTSLDNISYNNVFNSNIYVQHASSHGWMLRYKNTSTLGFYNNENTRYFAVNNVKAGDKIEIAIAGTGKDGLTTPANPINATLSETTSTWTFNYTYNKARTFDYTVYTLDVTTDGVAGVQIAKGTLIGDVKLIRNSDGQTTGISSVKSEADKANNQYAYNLAGQRVQANAKGIVIINGKKYLNK